MTDSVIGRRSARASIAAATAASLVIGFACVFVRSPLPWGWQGIDRYHERALSIARGDGFPTMDVPAGYALYLAAFYRTFGDRPVAHLCGQVLLNALMPWLMHGLVRRVADERTARVTALLVGFLSFNTIYTSTLASDSVCNVVFVAGMLALAVATERDRLAGLAAAGVLFGVASQFRPNLILFPPVAGLLAALAGGPALRRAARAAVVIVVAAACAVPWTIRNYRLTGEIIPASTHGGMQLWYGTLQTGMYAGSRVYNPRAFFEERIFDASTIADRPIAVTVQASACAERAPADVEMVWWTDRSSAPARLAGRTSTSSVPQWTFELPGQPDPTVLYYYFDTQPEIRGRTRTRLRPGVFFITRDVLADPDRHGDLLDVHDVARLAAHRAWGEPIPFPDRLDVDRDGALDDDDLRLAGAWLLAGALPAGVAPTDAIRSVSSDATHTVVRFADASTLTVPRGRTGRYTDLEPTWKLAQQLFKRTRPMRDVTHASDPSRPTSAPCPVFDVQINKVFYRDDPDQMHRLTALAIDNIRRAPWTFFLACLYRVYRVFVVDGGIDVYTVARFSGDTVIYALAHAASLTYAALFVAGVVVTAQRRRVPWLLLAPVVYVPLTIAPVLINMRYSITVQPFVLAFAAILFLAAVDRARPAGSPLTADTSR